MALVGAWALLVMGSLYLNIHSLIPMHDLDRWPFIICKGLYSVTKSNSLPYVCTYEIIHMPRQEQAPLS